ncbi:MAG: DegV family protein [Lachnoclostridium sp.]|nr:DegV family protein [Lachnoclostridium sp.]
MEKVAILTDSNSGITQAQADELGMHIIPMPFNIGDTSYIENDNITRSEFYEKISEDIMISTSPPALEEVMDVWENLLESYEELVFIPMSSGLSSSCQTAILLTYEEEFEDKVFVVDNQRVSATQRQAVFDAKNMADKGMSAKEIYDVLTNTRKDFSTYIMVDTLTYLRKGGRITPVATLVGNVMQIKPVLQLQEEKLDAFAKVKTVKQAKSVMIKQVAKDMETRFGGADEKRICLSVAHTNIEKAAAAFRQEVMEEFPGFQVTLDDLPLSGACHLGPGALGLSCMKVWESK